MRTDDQVRGVARREYWAAAAALTAPDFAGTLPTDRHLHFPKNEVAMPRYYFNIHHDRAYYDGLELDNKSLA